MARTRRLKAGGSTPVEDLVVAEAEPAMRMIEAQELERVRRVHDRVAVQAGQGLLRRSMQARHSSRGAGAGSSHASSVPLAYTSIVRAAMPGRPKRA